MGNIPGVGDPQDPDLLPTTKDSLTGDISYSRDPPPTDPLPTELPSTNQMSVDLRPANSKTGNITEPATSTSVSLPTTQVCVV